MVAELQQQSMHINNSKFRRRSNKREQRDLVYKPRTCSIRKSKIDKSALELRLKKAFRLKKPNA